jgi:Asp/Glu/hydantoin racemase
MERHKVLFIHASQAAMVPINEYYQENAPELQLINILDDGLLELFKLNHMSEAANTIIQLVRLAQNFHHVKAVLITCSALARPQLHEIKAQIDIPVVKVDLPMLQNTVEMAEKIGIIASFPPGAKSSMDTLLELAREKKKDIRMVKIFNSDAYDALLKGDVDLHDKLILKEIQRNTEACDAYILTQVSLAHLKESVERQTHKPVFASPQESLVEIRKSLGI